MLEDKAIVNAEDAVRSIMSGMTDEALMEKYELSQKGLESLFRKLIATGAIEQSDLDRRRGSLHGLDRMLPLSNLPRLANVEEEDEEGMVLPSDNRSIWVEYKHYFFAVGGAFVGGLPVILGMTFFGEAGSAKPSQSAPVAAPVAIADKGEPAQAEQIIFTGQADAVLLARQFLRDPYWPLHAARALGVDIPWPQQYERAKN